VELVELELSPQELEVLDADVLVDEDVEVFPPLDVVELPPEVVVDELVSPPELEVA